MAEVALEHSPPRTVAIRRRNVTRVATASLLGAVFVGNLAAIVWLWWHGGNVLGVHGTGEWLTSFARITGLLGAYSALLQVLMLARLPWLERLVGFDRLSAWHRWNGHACLDLVLAHVVLSVWGYALMDRLSKRGLTLHYVVGDHRTAEGREHLSPEYLRELVPDIAERDVYVCGPPGLTDVLETHVRVAGVPKRFIHAERFAL